MVDLHKLELKTKMWIFFLIFFCLVVFFFHIFAIANQLPGFSIGRLANVEDSFNVNIFHKCKYKCEYKKFFI